MPLTEISHVITKLDYIIHWSKLHNSAMGYFPALYQRTTIEVERGIDAGLFNYPEDMTNLDITFAKYYIDAFESYMRQEPYVSSSWLYSFEMAKTDQLSVLQHLFLGMNAHINLDLGIAMADIATPETIGKYKHDFFMINYILNSLVDQMQDNIAEVWGPLRFIDFLLGRLDEKLIEWVLRSFRNRAWEFANRLVRCGSEKDRLIMIGQQDQRVTRFAERIGFPIALKFNPLYHAIIKKEANHTAEIIDILHDAEIYTKW